MKYTSSLWQLIVVIATIGLLSLSALPTFYGKTEAKNQQNQLVEHSNAPQWLQSLGFSPIKLGLDLYGGVLFVIHVDTEFAKLEITQNTAPEIRQFLRMNQLHGVNVSIEQNKIKLILSDNAIKAGSFHSLQAFVAQQMPNLKLNKLSSSVYYLDWHSDKAEQFSRTLMTQSVSIMRKRIESLGITEAAIAKQGKSHIRIELPGIKDPEQAKVIIGTTATLDVFAVAKQGASFNKNNIPLRDRHGRIIDIVRPAIFTGSNIKDASAGIDELGVPLVKLVLDKKGGESMARFSKANIGEPMATVFSEYVTNETGELVKNSKVINVANIVTALGNRFSITNMPSPQAAKELAMLIRAGSLNAPLSIVEQRTINPTLGKENVSNGFAALALGLGLTMLFMACWYRKLGLIANVSLVVNLICLIGLMALLPNMVLTLPGIAGLVLTVGMAVDTNVLVFERIKAEMQKTRQAKLAVKNAFSKAMSAIFDANITTMICALILMSIGNGPVKGFAMTLSLGIITSLFSGLFVSRLLTQLFENHLYKSSDLTISAAKNASNEESQA